MNPFNNNIPPLNPPQAANPAKKRALEEESGQKTKRQKLEKEMTRVYNNSVDKMAINEKEEPGIQELDKHFHQLEVGRNHEKAEKVEINPTNSSSSHAVEDAMDIDGDVSAVKANITSVQSKTEKVTKPTFEESKKYAADEKELRVRHRIEPSNLGKKPEIAEKEIEKEVEVLTNLIKENSEDLNKKIDDLFKGKHLRSILERIDWKDLNNDVIDHFLTHFFSTKTIMSAEVDSAGKITLTRSLISHLYTFLKNSLNRPLRMSLLVWNKLAKHRLLENHETIRLNCSDTMIYVIPNEGSPIPPLVHHYDYSLPEYLAKRIRLKNFYMPRELLDLAHQMLTQGLKNPEASTLTWFQKYQENQVMKFLGKPDVYLESTIDKWNSQMSLFLNGYLDFAYETDGAIPVSPEHFTTMENFPKEFWDKWLAIKIVATDGIAYVWLNRNDFEKHFPHLNEVGFALIKELQFPSFQDGYDVNDYIRFFKEMKFQNVFQYTLEETLKLFSLSIVHKQIEIIPACERRLIELLNADNVGEIADHLPPNLKDVAPSLHTKIQRLLWDKVYSKGWKEEALNALSPKQKNLMDSFALSEPLVNLAPSTFQILVKHFSSHIKKLALKDLPDELLPLLQDFSVLKEFEIEHLEYNAKMAKLLKQLPKLDTLSFKEINLASPQKQPFIKKLRLQSEDIQKQDLDKLFSVFNALTHLEVPIVRKDQTESVFTRFIGDLKTLQKVGFYHNFLSPGRIVLDVEALRNLKIFHSDAIPVLNRINIQFPLLEEVSLPVSEINVFTKSCPNLKKATFISSSEDEYSPVPVFSLNHLSKLEDIHIKTVTIKREVLEDLSKLHNLIRIRIEANVLMEDKPNPLDDIMRLPKLESLACKSELMTQAAYEYAMNNGIKVEIL